jgi:hypothetical protein
VGEQKRLEVEKALEGAIKERNAKYKEPKVSSDTEGEKGEIFGVTSAEGLCSADHKIAYS